MATDLQIQYEKQTLAANGGSDGRLQVASTANLRKGARILLVSGTVDAVELVIDRIVDGTHIEVRDPTKIGSCLFDCSAYKIAGLGTPVNAAFSTATTGGSLVAATYYYRVSALNWAGETLASTETSQVVPAGTATNTVTVNWAAVTGATGYKVYGRSTGAELLIATVGNVTTFVDTGAVTPAGALPGADTTANSARVTQNLQVDYYASQWLRF